MCSHDQDYPWVFRRNELDLLEDELEDLYERFSAGGGPDSVWQLSDTKDICFEVAILQEQLDTEERSDHELSARLGFDVLEELPEPLLSAREGSSHDSAAEHGSFDSQSVRTHPLYQQSRQWMNIVKPMAKDGYERGGPYAAEWFRVYANVNLIPLKVFTALSEEFLDDEVGFVVAQEEYQLALLYLQRILESMTLMTFDIEYAERLRVSRAQTEELRSALASQLLSLRRRRSSDV